MASKASASKLTWWFGWDARPRYTLSLNSCTFQSLKRHFNIPLSCGTIHYLLLKAYLLFHSQETNAMWHLRALTDVGTAICLTWSIQGFTNRGLKNFTYHTLHTDPGKRVPGRSLLVASGQDLALQSRVMEGSKTSSTASLLSHHREERHWEMLLQWKQKKRNP